MIKIGDKSIGVRASHLALIFYKQEFKRGLIADFTAAIVECEKQNALPDEMVMMQMAWAMHKAYTYPAPVETFNEWFMNIGDIDFSSQEMYQGLINEAVSGFFQKALIKGPPVPEKR